MGCAIFAAYFAKIGCTHFVISKQACVTFVCAIFAADKIDNFFNVDKMKNSKQLFKRGLLSCMVAAVAHGAICGAVKNKMNRKFSHKID